MGALQRLAQRLRREHERVVQAEPTQVCEQVHQKVLRYRAERRILELPPVIACVADGEENELLVGCPAFQRRLEHARRLQVAASKWRRPRRILEAGRVCALRVGTDCGHLTRCLVQRQARTGG